MIGTKPKRRGVKSGFCAYCETCNWIGSWNTGSNAKSWASKELRLHEKNCKALKPGDSQ